MSKIIETDIQIRFADVDSLRHVNNVNLQHYFDTGKLDFMRHTLADDINWKGDTLILAHVSTDYFEQTRMDDKVYVETKVEKIGTKSVTFVQRLINRDTGIVNAECHTVSVGFNMARQESIEILPKWKSALRQYMD